MLNSSISEGGLPSSKKMAFLIHPIVQPFPRLLDLTAESRPALQLAAGGATHSDSIAQNLVLVERLNEN